MILDAGVLISIDRSDHAARTFLTAAERAGTPLHTTHPVLAQVWRDGARQARLAAFTETLAVHPLDDGAAVGKLLGVAQSSEVVDAPLVLLALRLGDDVLTGDPDDLEALAAALGPAAPTIHHWP